MVAKCCICVSFERKESAAHPSFATSKGASSFHWNPSTRKKVMPLWKFVVFLISKMLKSVGFHGRWVFACTHISYWSRKYPELMQIRPQETKLWSQNQFSVKNVGLIGEGFRKFYGFQRIKYIKFNWNNIFLMINICIIYVFGTTCAVSGALCHNFRK